MDQKTNSSNAGIRPAPKKPMLGLPSTKQKKFAAHLRRKNLIAEAIDKRGHWKQAAAIRDCTETEHLTGCTHCGQSWWVTTKCRQRVCPICAWKVAQDRAVVIEGFLKDLKHPKFVTLTMPRWLEDGRSGIKFIREAFMRLRKSGSIPELVGGCYSVELVPKDGGWHIHMHLIIDCAFVPQKRLIAAWGKALGVHAPTVDVRDAEKGSAAKYVAKYVTKGIPHDSDPDTYVDLWEAIHGSRLFALFGSWYKDKAKIEALGKDREDGGCKCPSCGERGTLFDVRMGRFIWGEGWEEICKAYEPADGRCTRPKDGIFKITVDDVAEEVTDEEEDVELLPYCH